MSDNIKALLFAVFLGWCGGYRFYKKQFLLGIIYLFTFGLFGIGWIVDIILSAINCVSDTGSLEVEASHSPNRVISYHRRFMLEDVHERCMLNPSLKRHEILSACTLDDKYYLKLSDHRGIHDFLVINDRLNLDIGLIPSELGITFYQYRDRNSEVVMLEKGLFDVKMQFVVYKD